MKFPFRYELIVDKAVIATITGNLLIEADHSDPASIARAVDAEWTVDEVEINATGAADVVTLPDTHPLHDKLLVDLISKHRREIDAAWKWWLASKRNEARKGFAIAPAVGV